MMGGKWIIDGNFVGTIDNRASRADTVIFLDPSKIVIYWRFLRRSFKDFKKERRELVGNYLKEKWGVFKYILNFPRQKIYSIIEPYRGEKKIIVLNTLKKVENLLRGAGTE